MKELSTEQKAKRYNEILEKARKELQTCGSTDCEAARQIFRFFPELKESEDERIKKALIKYFSYEDGSTHALDYITPKQILAWLEKQGEHKRFRDFIQVGDKVTRNESGELVNISQLERIAKPRRAKPAKLKFHVGDWIVQENIGVYKVIEVCESWYEVVDNKGNHYSIGFDKEYMCHLWTIKDAKDGDVLVCPKYAGDIIPNIFIFKDIKIKDNDVFCYCSFIEAFRTESYIANADPINTDFYPATKEQRDTLFAKIIEAGYEWDADKKELKRIVITNLIKDCITQKPAKWSEEDEDMLYKTISVINRLCAEGKEYVWSINTLKKLFYWLKSLKNKYTWKPTKQQLTELRHAISGCSFETSILVELEENLKKLL